MKTAIVTGASAGLGREIVRQIAAVFPEIEAYWLIARRQSAWKSWLRLCRISRWIACRWICATP